MHCPRCGQQQISEEIKFCSRCGFPLGLVSEIISHGGFLPQLAELHNSKKVLTRNNGLKMSLIWFLLITFIFVPLAAITHAPGGFIAGFSIIGVCGAMFLAALSFLFLPKAQNSIQYQNETNAPQFLGGNKTQNALPPPISQPFSSYVPPAANSWKAPDTGELVPHSVTEGTTKLLQKDE